ncbi:hypothetical protein [Parasphingorhabdus sp.]|uniref:hypothetical protein n=1 Tax=Parasphingorhabdus sp. TaxID=2709688 RepID=UPI003A92A5E3
MHFTPPVEPYSGRQSPDSRSSGSATGPGAFVMALQIGHRTLISLRPAQVSGLHFARLSRRPETCANQYSTTICDII